MDCAQAFLVGAILSKPISRGGLILSGGIKHVHVGMPLGSVRVCSILECKGRGAPTSIVGEYSLYFILLLILISGSFFQID